jgi:hypothetical protein
LKIKTDNVEDPKEVSEKEKLKVLEILKEFEKEKFL